MIKKLEQYVKKDEMGLLKVAALFSYSDTAPVRNWIRRRSVPKYQQARLKKLLEGEIDVRISIE